MKTVLIFIITHLVCIAGGVIAGAAIWRNNANKFSRIEQEATADVKTWLRKVGINI